MKGIYTKCIDRLESVIQICPSSNRSPSAAIT
jgi:hypothetical protein